MFGTEYLTENHPAFSHNNTVLPIPRVVPGGHSILPVVLPDLVPDQEYATRFSVAHGHLSISLKVQNILRTYERAPPHYSVTLTAVQRQRPPIASLGVNENNELWTEDGDGHLRRIVVGGCQGQVQGHFFFPCWGCKGVCDSVYEHHNCPYGVLKVEQALLHPSFNQDAFPENPELAYQLGEIWQDINPQYHLRLSLAYSPGYGKKAFTWYETFPAIPVFATETEALLAEYEKQGQASEM